jgi:hypothetical protein
MGLRSLPTEHDWQRAIPNYHWSFGCCSPNPQSISSHRAFWHLHFDPFQRGYFLWYLISLTMGPVFIAAAIYLCLGRIVVVYGEEISRIKPRAYTMFFLFCDFIALSIQTVGGAIAASAPITNKPMVQYSLPMFPLIVLLILVAQSWNPHSCRRSFLSSCKFVCILGVRSRISVASV